MLKISHTWTSGTDPHITSRESTSCWLPSLTEISLSPQTLINAGMSYHFSDYSSIILLLQSNLLHLNQLLLPPFIFTDRFLRISLQCLYLPTTDSSNCNWASAVSVYTLQKWIKAGRSLSSWTGRSLCFSSPLYLLHTQTWGKNILNEVMKESFLSSLTISLSDNVSDL